MPMENLNLIQNTRRRRHAAEAGQAGGTAWARTKASVKKAMRDMARRAAQALRHAADGAGFMPFSKDSPVAVRFEDAFEFDETEDQESAIDDVKSDMESRSRWTGCCGGDVGYGKTEVANAGRVQIRDGWISRFVVLRATTGARLPALPNRFSAALRVVSRHIELLTRYYSARKKAILPVETGEIRTSIIGTHRVLSKDIKLKDIASWSSTRSSVRRRAEEKLKADQEAIDVLSMSATPIPRTLQHVAGRHPRHLRDRDAAKDRLAIQTAVVPFTTTSFREASSSRWAAADRFSSSQPRRVDLRDEGSILEKLVARPQGHRRSRADGRARTGAGHAGLIQRETTSAGDDDHRETAIDIPACTQSHHRQQHVVLALMKASMARSSSRSSICP